MPNACREPGEVGRRHVGLIIHRLFIEGVTARNAQAYFKRTYHPDVTIHEAPSLPYGGEYHGLASAAEHALGFTRARDGLQTEEQRLMSPRIVATDSSMTEIPAISHYRFHEGRIEARMCLFDTAAVRALLDPKKPS